MWLIFGLQELLWVLEIPRRNTPDTKKLVRGEHKFPFFPSYCSHFEVSNFCWMVICIFFFEYPVYTCVVILTLWGNCKCTSSNVPSFSPQRIRDCVHSHWCCHRPGGKGNMWSIQNGSLFLSFPQGRQFQNEVNIPFNWGCRFQFLGKLGQMQYIPTWPAE